MSLTAHDCDWDEAELTRDSADAASTIRGRRTELDGNATSGHRPGPQQAGTSFLDPTEADHGG